MKNRLNTNEFNNEKKSIKDSIKQKRCAKKVYVRGLVQVYKDASDKTNCKSTQDEYYAAINNAAKDIKHEKVHETLEFGK